MAMKKIACCLWLILLMPSMALSLERRDGAYYCTVKFVGGLTYTNALKEWQGAFFKPSGNFVVKLSFLERTKASIAGVTFDLDEYDVTVTDERNSTDSCLHDKKPPTNEEKFGISCDTVINEYKFNFDNHRFIKIYTEGYVNGVDSDDDTPSISGGLCTKISQ
jgi:hypothetical protein